MPARPAAAALDLLAPARREIDQPLAAADEQRVGQLAIGRAHGVGRQRPRRRWPSSLASPSASGPASALGSSNRSSGVESSATPAARDASEAAKVSTTSTAAAHGSAASGSASTACHDTS